MNDVYDVYLVVCNDRHEDVLISVHSISVHSKLSGAESRVLDLMEEYDRKMGGSREDSSSQTSGMRRDATIESTEVIDVRR